MPKHFNCIVCNKRTAPKDRRIITPTIRRYLCTRLFIEDNSISAAHVICNKCKHRYYIAECKPVAHAVSDTIRGQQTNNFCFIKGKMAKLLPSHQGTLLQSDLVNIIHDKVVSLCQKKYSSVNFIEIDGLICISLLDTKEQQVVKIHKTLTSISGKPDKHKHNRKDQEPSLLKELITGPTVNTVQVDVSESTRSHSTNYLEDVNTLSELLKSSTNQSPVACLEQVSERKSKRKRKQPQQRTAKNTDFSEAKKTDGYDNRDAGQYHGTPRVNPFIHPNNDNAFYVGGAEAQNEKDKSKSSAKEAEKLLETNVNVTSEVVKIKAEPIDTDYENAEETQPKIVSVTSIAVENDSQGKGKLEKVSNIIDRLIEEDYQRRDETIRDESMIGQREMVVDQQSDQLETGNHTDARSESTAGPVVWEMGKEMDGDFKHIVVKTEKVSDDYPGTGMSSNNDTADESENVASNIRSGQEGQSEEEMREHQEFAARIGLNRVKDSERPVEGEHVRNSLASDSNSNNMSRSHEQKKKRSDSPRSWIDMVKDNVSKYQAALVRSGKPNAPLKVPELCLNEDNNGGSESVGAGGSSLLNLLQKPPMSTHTMIKSLQSNTRDADCRSSLSRTRDLEKGGRSSSVPRNTCVVNSNSDRSSSCSPLPVVKIEVDDVSYGAVVGIQSHSEPEARSQSPSVAGQDIGDNSKPSGKLESRYPALFNQLQVSKKDQAENAATAEPGDSLVNRLPFISFQEIFSTAASGSVQVPRLSESTTRQLLEQAKVSPYPTKTNPKRKSIWNWKKRCVRKKVNDDSSVIASNAGTDSDPSSVNMDTRPLGIHMSASKTISRRLSRGAGKSESDQEWQPTDTDEIVFAQKPSDDIVYPESNSRSTRLSRRKKPRINFAEIDNSDLELEEEDEEEDDWPMMSCCGIPFYSQAEFDSHGLQCHSGAHGNAYPSVNAHSAQSALGGENIVSGHSGGVANNKSSVANNKDQFQCSLCGLDFNQQYRWHYHMVKVHGITADKIKFFR